MTIEKTEMFNGQLKRQNEEQYFKDILKPEAGKSLDEHFKDILDRAMKGETYE